MKRRNGRAEHHKPAFQFYPGDFLSDAAVVAMTMEERGAYITLLCHQWIEGSIPADPAILARLVHMEREAFQKLWGNLVDKFTLADLPGRLKNARLERERAFMEERKAERVKILEEARKKKGAAGISRSADGISRSPMPERATFKENTPEGISRSSVETPDGISRSAANDLEKTPLAASGSMIEHKQHYDRVHHYHSPLPLPQPQATLGVSSYSSGNSPAQPDVVTQDAEAPETCKKRGRPRKPPTGDHADFARYWEQNWLKTRGVPYVYSAKDGIAAAQILKLKGSSLAEACLRADRMLRSSDPWIRSNASVQFLLNRWNQMATISTNTPEPKGLAAIRQVLAEQEPQP